jgi:membrane protein DedA with SNARE-associated domain
MDRARGGNCGACRGDIERRRQSPLTDFVAFLEQLPPGPVYVIIAVLAGVENIFPPVPADVGVALGAFLSGRGVMNPWIVFGLTWSMNVASAAGVYALARRHGDVVTRGFLGRHIFTPNTVRHIEEQYRRHGTYGIFLSRLLPVWRAVVMPFAGMAQLPAWKALPPMAIASALYYGALTYLVMRLGTDFDAVVGAIKQANTAMAIVAGIVTVIIVVWIVRRRRRRNL